MDEFIPSQFPFDQTDNRDPLLQLSSSSASPNFEDCGDLIQKFDNRVRLGKVSQSFAVDGDDPADNKKRKIIHRDVERQRRQEMSTLYRALRSLLPLEYLKGRRSISDQMHQAVNYIKDVQKKIQELSEKRDELQRRLSDSSTSGSGSECLQSHMEDSITVRPCFEGVEVVVSTTFRNGIPLSRVLEVLIGEGLSIVNFISSKMNEKFLHSINSEVNDGRNIDFHELQRKLMKLTNPSLD